MVMWSLLNCVKQQMDTSVTEAMAAERDLKGQSALSSIHKGKRHCDKELDVGTGWPLVPSVSREPAAEEAPKAAKMFATIPNVR